MSLTVQQLLTDAKRLSTRLRDHDQTADTLITRAQEVLKQVDAMRQYQEDVENLNEVAHNRPRAQLVLGIQQENRHIRTLQQENKELRAALEEHQNALELIMSKYRQHVTRLVNCPKPDFQGLNNRNIQMLAERTEKVCEMAAVMKEAVKVDEENTNLQQETMARLVTENKGLRELLDISQKSKSSPRVKKIVSNVHKEVQTDDLTDRIIEQEVTVTLPMPPQPKPPPRSPKPAAKKVAEVAEIERSDVRESLELSVCEVGSGDEETDETGSEDESVKYDTIKLADVRRNKTSQADQTVLESSKVGELDLVEERTEKESPSPSPDKKLSPSEELVNNLVEQLVTDSMTTGEKDQTPDKEPDSSSQESSPTKTRAKNKKGSQSRNSSRKNKK